MGTQSMHLQADAVSICIPLIGNELNKHPKRMCHSAGSTKKSGSRYTRSTTETVVSSVGLCVGGGGIKYDGLLGIIT